MRAGCPGCSCDAGEKEDGGMEMATGSSHCGTDRDGLVPGVSRSVWTMRDESFLGSWTVAVGVAVGVARGRRCGSPAGPQFSEAKPGASPSAPSPGSSPQKRKRAFLLSASLKGMCGFSGPHATCGRGHRASDDRITEHRAVGRGSAEGSRAAGPPPPQLSPWTLLSQKETDSHPGTV